MKVPPPMGRVAWAIAVKELVEALRDRRTVLLGLVLPVLVLPAITLGLPHLAVREQRRLEGAPARVAVTGREHMEAFVVLARDGGWITLVDAPDPRDAVRRGLVDAAIEAVPREQGPLQVNVLYDETAVASVVARQKISEAAAQYSVQQVQERLAERGLEAETLLPLEIRPISVRPPEAAARGQLAAILPFFMAVWMMLGGQYAALDLGAGERERGTLPGLLVTPPPRLVLVLGKFTAVFLLAMVSVVLVVASVLVSLRLAPHLLGASAPPVLPPGLAAPIIAVGLALAAFLSAMQLLMSLAARSVREAQQLFTPLYLIVIASVVLAQVLPGLGRSLWIFAVPIVNGAYLLRGLLLETVGSLEVAVAAATLSVLTVAILLAGAWIYRRERLATE